MAVITFCVALDAIYAAFAAASCVALALKFKKNLDIYNYIKKKNAIKVYVLFLCNHSDTNITEHY